MKVCGRTGNAYYGIAEFRKLLPQVCYTCLIGTVYFSKRQCMFVDHPEISALEASCVTARDHRNSDFFQLCLISRSLYLSCRVAEFAYDRPFLDTCAEISGKGLHLHGRIRCHLHNLYTVGTICVHQLIPLFYHQIVLLGLSLFHPAFCDLIDGIEHIILR